MNVTPCHYSIVRFLPFVETGEFANVGVVLFAPTARRFAFRILSKRVARITAFFEQIDATFVRNAIRTFEQELDRVASAFKTSGTDRRLRELNYDRSIGLWEELVRPRETLLRLSESRVVMASDPVKKLEELFDFYVERNFVTKEYQEQTLDRAVRKLLYSFNLGDRFQPQVVGNDEYHAKFPFVEMVDGLPAKAIKPLHLAHQEPAKIIDHGGQWIVRVNALRKRDLLPTEVLFAVESGVAHLTDLTADSPRERAQQEIIGELRRLDVSVVPLAETNAIVSFAKGSGVWTSFNRH